MEGGREGIIEGRRLLKITKGRLLIYY